MKRNRDTFDDWFLTLHPRVLVTAQRLLGTREAAEDVVAEAFSRALVRWARLEHVEHRDAWLYRVAVNLSLDQLRRGQRHIAPATSGEPGSPEQATAELRLLLMAALRRLSRRQREAIVLRYVGQLSEREVADALEVSVETAKTHLKRGLAALRCDPAFRDEEVLDVFAIG